MAASKVSCEVCGRLVHAYVGTETPRVHWSSDGKCAGGGKDAAAKRARLRARQSAGGKKGGRSKSAKKRKASAANGEKGGRPPKHNYEEIFAALENPADVEDPLELPKLLMQWNAIALFETLQGRGNRELNAEIRAVSRVITDLLPRERLRQAEAAVRGATKKTARKKRGGTAAAGGAATTTAPAPSESRPIR